MDANELKKLIRDEVEAANGTISDAVVKAIGDQVDAKFAELAKGPQGKAFGGGGDLEAPKFESLGEFLNCVYKAAQPGETPDKRLVWKAPYGMNEASPSEGGYLLEPQRAMEMIQIAHEMSNVYQDCTKIPIGPNSNSLTLYGVDETSRANGSRWGGIQVYWSDEAGTVTATKPKWREMNLKLKKLMGLAYVTGELLSDATALQSVVTQAFTEEMAYKLQDGIFNGTGAGQLLGILNSPALVTQAAEVGQPSATVQFENVLKMWNRLPARLRAKAKWYMIQDVETQLMMMFLAAGTAGLPVSIYLPPAPGAVNGTLMGRQAIPIEQAQALGTIGDIMLCDMSQYLLIDKGNVQADSSIHVRFVNDENTFRFIYRVDGQPMWHNTLTSANSAVTRSPFVALAAR